MCRSLVLALFIVCSLSPALAQPGTLDSGFGDDGRVVLAPFGGANAVAPLAGGGLLLAARREATEASVLRLHDDGSLDTGYGTDGFTLLNFGPSGTVLTDLVALGDGASLVSGYGVDGTATLPSVLARLTPDGQLDPDFGEAGTLAVGGFDELRFERLTAYPDGRALAVGWGVPEDSTEAEVVVVRLTADGELDPGFGTEGVARVGGPGTYGADVSVRPDGRLVVAANSAPPQQVSRVPFVARLLPDGLPDATFGTDGLQPIPYNLLFLGVSDMGLDGEGRILLIGYGGVPAIFWEFTILVVLRPDGVPDTTFGNDATLVLNSESGGDVAVQDDGKPVVL